ncbi:hypothetical protein LSAT2_005242, partial [Lamellibrachia satsuma]
YTESTPGVPEVRRREHGRVCVRLRQDVRRPERLGPVTADKLWPRDIIESAGNSLFVSFVSDDSLTAGGFRVGYTTIKDGNTDNPAAGNSGCDGTTAQLTGPSGEFGTNGPQYQNGMSCSWKITVPVGM